MLKLDVLAFANKINLLSLISNCYSFSQFDKFKNKEVLLFF